MIQNKKTLTFFLVMCLSLISGACGKDSGNSTGSTTSGNDPITVNPYVDWNQVPANLNPEIDTIDFNSSYLERFQINYFGFSEDVRVIYKNNDPMNAPANGFGSIKIYRVYQNKMRQDRYSFSQRNKDVTLSGSGIYNCKIQVQNALITQLDGSCVVRIDVYLPEGSELEVYDAKKILTKQFLPMPIEVFIKQFKNATWDADKHKVIDQYLASFQVSRTKKPSLLSVQLAMILRDFMLSEDKFIALRKLHLHISDRNNLRDVINNEFKFYEREEAFRIVGLY